MDEKIFAWNLDINDALTTSLTSQVITVALGIAGICFICNLAYNYLSSGFSKLVGGSKESFPDYTEIARCFVLIVCISSYLPIANIIVGSIEVANKATSPNELASMERYQEAMATLKNKAIDAENTETGDLDVKVDSDGNKYITDDHGNKIGLVDIEYSENDENSSVLGKVVEFLGKLAIFFNPTHFVTLGLHSLVYLIVVLIKLIITGIVVIMTKILVIVGPLAFAFSILPCFRKQVDTWFGTLLNTGMTLTTINILDAIYNQITYHMVNKATHFDVTLENITVDYQLLIALDAVLIVLYCSCFWLTSKYVGKGDAGRVLSKMVAVATTLAAVAITGGTGTVAAGGANSAVNTAKNAIENNDQSEQ